MTPLVVGEHGHYSTNRSTVGTALPTSKRGFHHLVREDSLRYNARTWAYPEAHQCDAAPTLSSL